MTDKDLIKKLNSLSNISPDLSWKASNRDLLLSQISNSGARDLSAWQIFVINFNSLAKTVSKPAYALGAFVVLLITGSLFSHQVFGNAKPNDSLYIARIISEKAKLNTMFNSDERNKLAVQFATEHAQDISAVLANPEFNNDTNKDQVAKLNASFDTEINTVKNKINYLIPKKDQDVKEVIATDTVSMAGSSKDNSGVQLLEAKSDNKIATPSTATITPVSQTISSSTDASADTILDEAKQLFDKKDYTKASNKLKEVDELIK